MSSREAREEALRMAHQKGREAQQWWIAWADSIHRYRCWALYYVAHTRAIIECSPYTPEDLGSGVVRIVANVAHDQMLFQAQAVLDCARSATACEMAARIFYEQYEQRETGRGDVHE